MHFFVLRVNHVVLGRGLCWLIQSTHKLSPARTCLIDWGKSSKYLLGVIQPSPPCCPWLRKQQRKNLSYGKEWNMRQGQWALSVIPCAVCCRHKTLSWGREANGGWWQVYGGAEGWKGGGGGQQSYGVRLTEVQSSGPSPWAKETSCAERLCVPNIGLGTLHSLFYLTIRADCPVSVSKPTL